MAQSKKISYQDALSELEEILSELSSEKVDIDQLSGKLKRAYGLIDICRSRIRSAEAEVKKINNQFKNEKNL